jgi:hypothetical protein
LEQVFKVATIMVRHLAAGFVAAAMLWVGSGSAAILFQDDFNRADHNNLNNNWAEIEENAGAVSVSGNAMRMVGQSGGDIDAQAAQLSISTLGFETITLDFDWAALSASEAVDLLVVEWRNASGAWTTLAGISLFNTGLGSDTGAFTHQSVSLTGADDLANIEFRFRISVDANCCTGSAGSRQQEGALIDNVLLQGAAIPDPTPTPEPASLALLGLGLAGLGLLRRRR